MSRVVLLSITAFLLLMSCQQRPQTLSVYSTYINDPDNDYIKTRLAGPFIYSLQYLPPDYLALRELQSSSHPDYDSLRTQYEGSVSLQFTIAPNPDKATGDVMRSGISTRQELDQRLRTLNFGLAQYWTLESPSGTYYPVLSQLEQTSGLTDYRKIQLVFTSEEEGKPIPRPWTITFSDDIWGTGVNRWRWE